MGVTLSVTKMNGFPLGDSSAGFLNSNAFIGDPAFDLGSLILSPEISAPNGDPLMAPFSSDLPPAPPDVFGFGAFDRVFITQEELDKAQEKLPPDEVKTTETLVQECLEALAPYKVPLATDSSTLGLPTLGEQAVVSIFCVNFMQLGLGKLSVSSTGLHWIGESTETTMTLFFPLSVLSDVRLKRDPDSSDHSSFLLVTVRDALFAQFLINNETECSELVEALISSKKDGLKEMLQMEQSNFASSDLDDWYRRRKLEIETERDLAIQELVSTALQELQKLEEDYQNQKLTKMDKESTGPSICQLCYDLNETAVFIPCGHRICSTCLSSMGYKLETPIAFTCPWDRKAIAKVVMLESP